MEALDDFVEEVLGVRQIVLGARTSSTTTNILLLKGYAAYLQAWYDV
jgi:hypothetical protein